MTNKIPLDEGPPDEETPDPTSSEISPTLRQRPIPPVFQNISANGCKNVACENFGVPPTPGPTGRGRGKANPDGYAVVNVGSSGLTCRKCGKQSTLKNNKCIHEERERLGQGVFDPVPVLKCVCGSTSLRKFGNMASGAVRYQCKVCFKTFSACRSPVSRQKKSEKNEIVWGLVINKVPIRRMCEVAELTPSGLYGKIDFIYEQCRKFVADRERRLSSMTFGSRYLCTDGQNYSVNWEHRNERRVISLTAVSTADQDSGYIFGLIPNYDRRIKPADLERQCRLAGDAAKPYAMREFARLWTDADYQASASAAAGGRDKPSRGDLEAVENFDEVQLPQNGCQVHLDYAMHGHYWLLRHYFQGAAKVRCFIEDDPGLLSACMGAFSDRIKARTADVLQLDIKKEMTIGERRTTFGLANDWFNNELALHPHISAPRLKMQIMAILVQEARKAGRINDHWFNLPFPDYAEPMKRVRFVTDYGDMDDHHTANLILRASLWQIDTVFNRIRRRISIAERGVPSVRRGRRLWNIYAPYEPGKLEKVLTIYRCWHNYIWKDGRNKKTAAEKLGIAAGAKRMQDILYFK